LEVELQQAKKENETLKLQLAAKASQLTAQATQLASALQQNATQATLLTAKDSQLTAQAAEIQQLKNKLFQ